MIHQPFISVIMPVFNEEAFVQSAIESILAQTYPHFELIIIDDVSADTTPLIIHAYQKRYPQHIKSIFLKKHVGPNEARNIGYRHAHGSFIAMMDADDIAHPQRLQKQITYLLNHPNVIILGCQGYVINKDNHVIGKKLFPLTHKAIYQQFGVFHPMLHPSCMIRRSLLPYLHKIYEDIAKEHDDYYTFFSLLSCGEFANLPDILHYYRVHGKNISLQHPKDRFYAIQKIRFYAIESLSYRMSIQAYVVNMLQLLLVALLPETCILPLYLWYRGMYSPSQFLMQFRIPQMHLSFSPKV